MSTIPGTDLWVFVGSRKEGELAATGLQLIASTLEENGMESAVEVREALERVIRSLRH